MSEDGPENEGVQTEDAVGSRAICVRYLRWKTLDASQGRSRCEDLPNSFPSTLCHVGNLGKERHTVHNGGHERVVRAIGSSERVTSSK